MFCTLGALAGLGSTHMSGMGNSAYNTIGYPSAQRSSALLSTSLLLKWLITSLCEAYTLLSTVITGRMSKGFNKKLLICALTPVLRF